MRQVNRKEGEKQRSFPPNIEILWEKWEIFCVFWLAGLSYVGSSASKEQISVLQNQFSYHDQFSLCLRIRSKRNPLYTSLCVVHISSSTLDIKRLYAGVDAGFTRELCENEENCTGGASKICLCRFTTGGTGQCDF